MAKNNYYDDDKKQKVVKKKKKGGFFKGLLIFILLILIAFAAFIATIKIVKPNFDLMTLVPTQVMALFDNSQKEEEQTTENTNPTENTQTTQAAVEESKYPIMDYELDKQFKFNTSVQGNFVGALLNGGLVGTDAYYVYHYVDGKGIYRFVPSNEEYALYFGISEKISCMNLRGDYIYYVNNKDNKLYKLSKGSKDPKALADDVAFAYIYDDRAYMTTTDGRVLTMKLDADKADELYDCEGDDVEFVGISLNRVYFTSTDFSGNVEYLTIDLKGKEVGEFRAPTSNDDILKLHMENGFMYYYEKQADNTYNLCRQKFGSQAVVTLVENALTQNYPEVNSNRMYYSSLENGKYYLKELNMNSNKTKTMLGAKDVQDENTLSFFLGGEYNFIIGNKNSAGDKVYMGSGIYTSSTNVMNFDNGSWSY